MKRELSQTQVAKQLGISKSYLSMILSGQRQCPPELASRLRDVHRSSQKGVDFKASVSLRGRCPRPLDECAALAGDPGFEPGLTDPESVVLPLD